MTYVISDIHGHYGAFLEMLEKICFSEEDLLFLNGDMIDGGEAPLRLLLDISYRTNVFPVLGDREYSAAPILRALYAGGKCVSEETVERWLCTGGESTLREMEALPDEQRRSVLDYLDDIPSFEAVIVNDVNYLMVHGGLANFSPSRKLESYAPDELISESAPFGRRYYKNTRILTGHVPTHRLSPTHRGKMICSPYQIALDCGAHEEIALGCYCIDSGEEFYVSL